MYRSCAVETTTLTALSPLDGRYAGKAAPLRRYLSEYALIRYRVLVEVRWLQHLADEPTIAALPPLQPAVKDVLNQLVDEFSAEDAQKVKAHEAVTNHDVKAVEYFIRDKTKGLAAAQDNLLSFIHFACTSEDINNLAYAMMLRDVRKRVLTPQLRSLITDLRLKAHRHADLAMLSRTHGQSASPTTLGKEMANFVARLERQTDLFGRVEICGKLNGAVGNFNAHRVAFPEADWLAISERFVTSLDLHPLGYTTQIDPHDWVAEYGQALIRINTVLLDLCRDVWGYVSLGYFRSRPTEGEVGSSTMPHKVNPIDFENAEGNLGVANALLAHLAAKLPISRWQRDLSDSTVLRTLGVALGHGFVAADSTLKGLGKLDVDSARVAADLEPAWEVLAEAIQTVLRAHGVSDAYEQLKSLTRGQAITPEILHAFIRAARLPQADQERLLSLTPAGYIGYAAELARNV
jgi:adenylosuccinate lyase